jgi:hypothetical protein
LDIRPAACHICSKGTRNGPMFLAKVSLLYSAHIYQCDPATCPQNIRRLRLRYRRCPLHSNQFKSLALLTDDPGGLQSLIPVPFAYLGTKVLRWSLLAAVQVETLTLNVRWARFSIGRFRALFSISDPRPRCLAFHWPFENRLQIQILTRLTSYRIP